MRKNQANIKKINNDNNKKNFLPIDWVVLGLFIFSILSNILLFIFRPELMNAVSNLLFQLLHLIFGIYFAYRVATISLMDKITEVQKSIAKTAIRQIRGTQFMIENLIGIINLKIDSFQDNKTIDTMKDINNHLSSLSINISSSESAFKDILGEEFKEEHLLWAKINETVNLLNEKNEQEKKLFKKKEKEDKIRLSELKNEINELKNQISSDISSLPITRTVRTPIISNYQANKDLINLISPADVYKGMTIDHWVPDLGQLPTTLFHREQTSVEEKERKEDKKTKK